MPEISQKMGFDASAAITTLGNLDRVLKAMNATVSASPAAFSAFNAGAGKTVSALKHLSSNAKTTATDLQKIVNLQSKVSATSAPKQAATATAKAATPAKTPDLSRYIAQLQSMYKISGTASKEQKRAFQSAITAAAEYAAKHKKTASDIASTNAKMAQNMTGTANKMANALTSISKKSQVVIPPPNVSQYAAAVRKLIPLTANATDAQKRAWQSLSTKIAESAIKGRMSIQQMLNIHGKLGQSLTGPANMVANNMQKMSNAGKKTAKTWVVSWETMSRVVATQMIVRILSSIRQALKGGVQDAIDFQKALAEIATISAGGLGNLGDIGGMVTRIASEWNMSLADTSEAAYQTVSNQIAKTEEDVESFLGTAAKFAKITKTDMSTAVDLLSGTLNAFEKDVGSAEVVAAKFFNTIKLGRTRTEELAQSIGSIQPIANQLGVSMEELNAGVATLSIQGMKTDKVVTQLRGVMQSFLKPTSTMKSALKELGFETGEQMLKAYNLQEAMVALKGTTDGSAQAFAKLVPRIRGMTGGIGLANDEVGNFTKSMEEQIVALGEYSDALTTVVSTDAEKATKAFNKLKITLTETFGTAVLRGFVHHLENINALLTPDSKLINQAIKEVMSERQNALALELEAELDAISFREKTYARMSAVARKAYFVAVEAANSANTELVAGTEWALNSIQAPIDAAVEGIKRAAAGIQEAIAVSQAFGDKSFDTLQKTLFQRSLGQVKDDPLLQISMLRKEAAKSSMEAQEAAIKGDTKAAEAAMSLFRSLNNQAYGIATSNQELQKSNIGKRQASMITQDLVLVEDRLQKANKAGQKSLKDSSKSLAESSRAVTEYQNRLNALRKELVDIQKQAADSDLTPDDQAALKKQAEDVSEEYVKTLNEGVERFAKDANPVVRKFFQDVQNINRDVEIETLLNVPTNMQSIFDIIKDAGEAYFDTQPIGFKIYAKLEGLEASTLDTIDAGISGYMDVTRENAVATNKWKQAQAGLQILLKGTAVQLSSLKKSLPQKEFDSFHANLEKISKGEFTLGNLERFQKSIVELAKTAGAGNFKDIQEHLTKLRKAVQEMPDKPILKNTFEQLSVDSISLDRYHKKMEQLSKDVSQIRSPIDTQAMDIQAVKQAEVAAFSQAEQSKRMELDQTKAKMDIIKSDVESVPLTPKIDTQPFIMMINGVKYELEDLPNKVGESTTTAGMLQNSVSLVGSAATNTADSVGSITSALEGSILAAQRLILTLSQAQSMRMPVTAAKGGPIGHFASGGRGTDTIPAMLSEGEFVTNAKSSRRFFSQLQAMNAGRTPVYRESGGSTTNIGDVSISVHESSSPRQTGREVMQAFRRELRRGSSRI